VSVRPIAGREHTLQLGVHVEVGDDADVLLTEQCAEARYDLSIRLQEGSLSLSECALGDQGVSRNS